MYDPVVSWFVYSVEQTADPQSLKISCGLVSRCEVSAERAVTAAPLFTSCTFLFKGQQRLEQRKVVT